MTIADAKNTVVLAGKKLVEAGLIARTWGNVSCRISESHFVITPSGRDYLSLTPEDIVEVAISDCSYTGDVKPSSEKGVHALVYKLHPEMNFVIHTHQDNASAISAAPVDSIKVSEESFPSLHGEVLCAAYGLPGTKKLRRNVEKALISSKGNAVIMKNHGALCFGPDYEEAFKTSHELEMACELVIKEQFYSISNQSCADMIDISEYALSKMTGRQVVVNKTISPIPMDSERGAEKHSEIHKEIYNSNTEINHILHSKSLATLAVSCAGIRPKPLLDDFAQIAGVGVDNVDIDPYKILSALKGSSAVLIRNNGALCCGSSRSDAEALSMVLEKNCMAYISAALYGKIKPINRLECHLMRFVYKKKYSKLKTK